VRLFAVCRRLNFLGLYDPEEGGKFRAETSVTVFQPTLHDNPQDLNNHHRCHCDNPKSRDVVVGHVVQLRSSGHCNEIREVGVYEPPGIVVPSSSGVKQSDESGMIEGPSIFRNFGYPSPNDTVTNRPAVYVSKKRRRAFTLPLLSSK
jgi:hypothetical protein